MTDDARNGGRPSVHPDIADFGVEDNPMDEAAKRALLARLGRRQKLADDDIFKLEDEIFKLEDEVARIALGTTPWQQAMTRQIQRLTDQVQVVMISRVAWPGITALGVLFLGGICAELVWRLATLH